MRHRAKRRVAFSTVKLYFSQWWLNLQIKCLLTRLVGRNLARSRISYVLTRHQSWLTTADHRCAWGGGRMPLPFCFAALFRLKHTDRVSEHGSANTHHPRNYKGLSWHLLCSTSIIWSVFKLLCSSSQQLRVTGITANTISLAALAENLQLI